MLLLCIAIVLVLGVIFYDSIPSNKVVPNKLATYTIPENVQSEIEQQITETNKVEVVYEITSSDLKLYKQTHSYTTGKPDPFSASTEGNGGTNNNTNTNTSTGGNTTTNTDSNSTNNYFNNTGLK